MELDAGVSSCAALHLNARCVEYSRCALLCEARTVAESKFVVVGSTVVAESSSAVAGNTVVVERSSAVVESTVAVECSSAAGCSW